MKRSRVFHIPIGTPVSYYNSITGETVEFMQKIKLICREKEVIDNPSEFMRTFRVNEWQITVDALHITVEYEIFIEPNHDIHFFNP